MNWRACLSCDGHPSCNWILLGSGKSEGKAVPLRSIEAHLGDRRYSSYSFLTSALEGGEWSASRSGRALPPDKEPPVPTVREAGWAPQPVWTQRVEKKSCASVGDRTPAVQSVVRHCTDWATGLLYVYVYIYIYIHEFRGIVLEGVDWSRLAHGKGRWRAFLYTVMNLWVP
jgi:hypothetical protein